MLTIGIVVGESSGDTLGAGLIKALRDIFPDIRFVGIAGPKMQAVGCEAFERSEAIEAMGLLEVIKKLPQILAIRRKLKKYLLDEKIDCFIGVDAPDFNLPLERFFKGNGIKTVHYVSPSVWAWRKSRIHGIKKSVDLMLTLFPFEVDIYREHQIPVEFVGHPLAESYPLEPSMVIETDLAILPGSREGEVHRLLPIFIETAKNLLSQKIIQRAHIALAKEAHVEYAEMLLDALGELKTSFMLSVGRAQAAMMSSKVVLLASGTATLEAMLAKKPMVVCYQLNALTFMILKRIVKIDFIALPNILAGEMLVPELLQDDVTPSRIESQIKKALLSDESKQIEARFKALHQMLLQNADQKAAFAIAKLLDFGKKI